MSIKLSETLGGLMSNIIKIEDFKKMSRTLWLKRDKKREQEGRQYNCIDNKNLILDVDPDIIKRMKKILMEDLKKSEPIS